MPEKGLEDQLLRYGGRGPGAATGNVFPELASRLRVERVEAPVEGGQVEPPVGDRGRELQQFAAVEQPDRPERWSKLARRSDPEPTRIESVGRPNDGAA